MKNYTDANGFPKMGVKWLHKLGYAVRKRNMKWKVYEKMDVVAARHNFFFKVSKNIAHSDTPSCIKMKRGVMRSKHNSTYGMVEENSHTLINCLRYNGGFDVLSGKGTCTSHCFCIRRKKGFVEETNICFVGNSKSEDHHREMNPSHFEEWLTEKVLLNIEDKTVIVIDNSPCHLKQIEEFKSWRN